MKININKKQILEEAGLTIQDSIKQFSDEALKIANKNSKTATPFSNHIEQFKKANARLREREPDLEANMDSGDIIMKRLSEKE